MGMLTALAVGVGAAGAAAGAKQAKKTRRSQEAEMARQDTLAREMGRLNMTKEGTGADIVLGTDFTKGGARNTNTVRQTPGNAPVRAAPAGTPVIGTMMTALMNQMMGIKSAPKKRKVPPANTFGTTGFAQEVMG